MYRSFLEWEWYSDLNTRVLFQHLILIANYKDSRLRGNVVKRGQVITSVSDLAKSSGLSVQNVRTSLSKLKLTNEITIVSSSEGSTITVVNYNSYQDANDTPNKRPTSNQQTTNKRLTTYKEDKNIRSKEDNINDGVTPFEKTFQKFEQMRTEIGKPLTETGRELILRNLEHLADGNENLEIKILEQSIVCNYPNVYKLNKDKSTSSKPRKISPI